jgi:hypothetical protein
VTWAGMQPQMDEAPGGERCFVRMVCIDCAEQMT